MIIATGMIFVFFVDAMLFFAAFVFFIGFVGCVVVPVGLGVVGQAKWGIGRVALVASWWC